MAVAKLVCGACGETISSSDVRCPSCGASIEKEESPAPVSPSQVSSPTTCGECGSPVTGGSEFCSSCGARLGDVSPVRPQKTQKPPRQPRKKEGVKARSIGVWQIISVIAILALLSYLAYIQIRGEKSGTASLSEEGAPPSGAPLAGIGLQSVNLKPLEDAVRERPGDPAARLRLANGLHDGRQLSRAVDEYRKYLTMRPKDPDARTDLGICYFQQAQSDSIHRESLLHQAASAMEEAFNSSPRPHQPSAFNLGVVYLHLNDLEQSNTWFKKARDINPDSDLGKRAQNMITQHTVPQ
jgi:hypothetical protein